MWDWELGQSLILGFPFQFFLPLRSSQGLISAAVIVHSYLSSPERVLVPDLGSCFSNTQLLGEGRTLGRKRTLETQEKGFSYKYIKKKRENLVPKNMRKLHPNTTASGSKSQTEHMSWERRQECQAVKSSPPPHAGE